MCELQNLCHLGNSAPAWQELSELVSGVIVPFVRAFPMRGPIHSLSCSMPFGQLATLPDKVIHPSHLPSSWIGSHPHGSEMLGTLAQWWRLRLRLHAETTASNRCANGPMATAACRCSCNWHAAIVACWRSLAGPRANTLGWAGCTGTYYCTYRSAMASPRTWALQDALLASQVVPLPPVILALPNSRHAQLPAIPS